VGSDGIAIISDRSRLYYCPLGNRKLYSVDANALANSSIDDSEVAATVIDEGDKVGG
jgi:sugar lactone lactonase YvrE